MNFLKRKSDDMLDHDRKKKRPSRQPSRQPSKKPLRQLSPSRDSDEHSEDERSLSDISSRFFSHKPELISRYNNHIYFQTDVNKNTISELVTLIREAEEECYLSAFIMKIPEIPIYLHINSFGGSIFAAFAAIDVIQACRVPVHTIIEGATASAGTLMSIVGKKRYITPSSYMLIHQLSSSYHGKMEELKDEFKNLQEMTKKIKDLYIKHCKIPAVELTKLLKHDLWLNADKCLKHGLVDELWTK
jgi:ATP-dependent Clp protease protease subunit